MFKALLLELIRPYIQEDKPSWEKYAVYCFAAIGLILLIAANYISVYHSDDYSTVILLIRSATIAVIMAILIESIRCYLKFKNRYPTFNRLKVAGQELVDSATSKANNLVPWGKLLSILPLISRIVPTSILTLIIYNLVKRALASYFYKK